MRSTKQESKHSESELREMLDWNIGDEVYVNTKTKGSLANTRRKDSVKFTWRGIVLPGTNGNKFDPKKKEIGTFSILIATV